MPAIQVSLNGAKCWGCLPFVAHAAGAQSAVQFSESKTNSCEASGQTITELNTAARVVSAAGSRAAEMLGATPFEQARVFQWMSFQRRLATAEDPSALLGSLNSFLRECAFLGGAAASLADVFVFWLFQNPRVGGAAVAAAAELPGVARWYDQMRNTVARGAGEAAPRDCGLRVQRAPLGALPLPAPAAAKKGKKPSAGAGAGAGASAGAAEEKPAEAKAGGKQKKGKKAAAKADAGAAPAAGAQAQAGAGAEAKQGKKKAKKEKKPKKQSAEPAAAAADTVSELCIRVGYIRRAWVHESADKLFCEEIDVGEDAPRQIASGLRPHYALEDMQNRRVLVLCNLKAKPLVGFKSHGMVLCASNEDKSVTRFVEPPEGAAVGERVTLEGFDGEPASESRVAKKKLFEKTQPGFAMVDGVATYKGAQFMTSAGPCVCSEVAAGSIS